MCEACGKSFAQAEHLKSHIKAVHEGVKNYKCKTCDTAFATNQNLKLHIEKCFQERKYKCLCGKKFRTRQNLGEHLQTDFECHMTPECDKCGKEFSDLRNLEKHICVKMSDQILTKVESEKVDGEAIFIKDEIVARIEVK